MQSSYNFWLVAFSFVVATLSHQKRICSDTRCGVAIKATPASPFVMTESELLFQVLIVALDAPAHLGHEHKLLKRRLLGGGSEKVFERAPYRHQAIQ